MKKGNSNNNMNEEAIIQKVLRIGGFIFPETPEEVNEFEKQFGNTDIILPEELKDLTFMSQKTDKIRLPKTEEVYDPNVAMAAREGSALPDEIKDKMKKERDILKEKK